MKLTNLFSMLGGLALFLYGMNMMSNGLEMAAGDKMKTILEKLTSNRILGVLVGALVTAIIQSSSATTVMVVGFVTYQCCLGHHGSQYWDNHYRSIDCY